MITEINEICDLWDLLPSKCIDACHCSGDNYAACLFWVEKLNLSVPRDKCVEILSEYGAWDDDELEDDEDKELNIKLLWIAAGWEGR